MQLRLVAGDHEYEVPPDALREELTPGQTLISFPAAARGRENTVMSTTSVAVQVFAPVTVTV